MTACLDTTRHHDPLWPQIHTNSDASLLALYCHATLLGVQVSKKEGIAQPSDEQLGFTVRLFDLNQVRRFLSRDACKVESSGLG